MEIISHRGYWKSVEEKNKVQAFDRSFSLGYGTETDLRDYKTELVISHDIANEDCMRLSNFFEVYQKWKPGTLALNIKSDGLQANLKMLIDQFAIQDYFVFDMSVPDTLGYIKEGINFFSRQSEHETEPVFYKECHGIWLDAFHSTWYDAKLILSHIQCAKKVAIVSSELHKREHLSLWEDLKKQGIHLAPGVILCTDLPEAASDFFNS